MFPARTSLGEKGTVNLQTVHRKFGQTVQRGIPGAEIVKMNAEAGLSELGEDRHGIGRLVTGDALGQLKDEHRGVDTGLPDRSGERRPGRGPPAGGAKH